MSNTICPMCGHDSNREAVTCLELPSGLEIVSRDPLCDPCHEGMKQLLAENPDIVEREACKTANRANSIFRAVV